MTYDHEAIYRSHPNVVRIKDGIGAFDASGNQVALDQLLVDAAASIIEEERSWSKLRQERNRLLAETDWISMKALDASIDGLGIQLPQVWMDYRQALRDLPANTTDPANPDWPVKPGGEA